MGKDTTFENLVESIKQLHETTSTYATGAVNQLLTVRNWVIGYYIVEFEQNGKDTAEYGSHLLENLSKEIQIKGMDRQMLTVCRLFYLRYPQICETVSRKLMSIGGNENASLLSDRRPSAKSEKTEFCETVLRKFETPPELLISRLSFSHLREIMSIDDPFERFFYEPECIRGTWSVRELRRQIDTKLYIRAGISKDPGLLLEKIQAAGSETTIGVKNAYALEFLGPDAKAEVDESALEQAIMDHLQEFLLELGKGFCFEQSAMQSELQSAMQSAMQSELQSELQSAMQSELQSAMQSARQSALQSARQSELQSVANSTQKR